MALAAEADVEEAGEIVAIEIWHVPCSGCGRDSTTSIDRDGHYCRDCRQLMKRLTRNGLRFTGYNEEVMCE